MSEEVKNYKYVFFQIYPYSKKLEADALDFINDFLPDVEVIPENKTQGAKGVFVATNDEYVTSSTVTEFNKKYKKETGAKENVLSIIHRTETSLRIADAYIQLPFKKIIGVPKVEQEPIKPQNVETPQKPENALVNTTEKSKTGLYIAFGILLTVGVIAIAKAMTKGKKK